MLTALGRVVLVVGTIGISILMFLYIGHQHRNLKANIQSFVQSQSAR